MRSATSLRAGALQPHAPLFREDDTGGLKGAGQSGSLRLGNRLCPDLQSAKIVRAHSGFWSEAVARPSKELTCFVDFRAGDHPSVLLGFSCSGTLPPRKLRPS